MNHHQRASLSSDLESISTALDWIYSLTTEAKRSIDAGRTLHATNLVEVAQYVAADFTGFVEDKKAALCQHSQGDQV